MVSRSRGSEGHSHLYRTNFVRTSSSIKSFFCGETSILKMRILVVDRLVADCRLGRTANNIHETQTTTHTSQKVHWVRVIPHFPEGRNTLASLLFLLAPQISPHRCKMVRLVVPPRDTTTHAPDIPIHNHQATATKRNQWQAVSGPHYFSAQQHRENSPLE